MQNPAQHTPPATLQARRFLKQDILKLICVFGTLIGAVAIFFFTPTLSTSTLLGIIFTMLLSPMVAALERRGYSRTGSILFLFLIIGALFTVLGLWATQTIALQWDSFKQRAPESFWATIARLQELEKAYQERYVFLNNFNPTESIMGWGEETGKWFLTNGPALVGNLLTWMLIVPFITFVALRDGRTVRKRLFELVPNRFFESSFMITTQIIDSLSDYIRAKLVEAFLVGLMVTLGLLAVGAPYPLVLGILAGVTNIIPYLGPVIGAVPGLIVIFFDPVYQNLLLPIALVYLTANVIDMALVFPLIVAKLVNLHPLLLIAVVVIGQNYYGLVGMLISIPIATAIKVILHEVHALIYKPVPNERVPRAASRGQARRAA